MSESRLEQELQNWREAYECLRQAGRVTLVSKTVPQDKKDAFLFKLELLSDDAQDLGDFLEQRIKNQKPKQDQRRW